MCTDPGPRGDPTIARNYDNLDKLKMLKYYNALGKYNILNEHLYKLTMGRPGLPRGFSNVKLPTSSDSV